MIFGPLKWFFKVFFQFVVWSYILSIHWDGRPLYDHAREHLFENDIVEQAENSLSEVSKEIYSVARRTLLEFKTEKSNRPVKR